MENIHSRDGFTLFSKYRPKEWVKRPCKTWDANMWGMFLDWYDEFVMDSGNNEILYVEELCNVLPFGELDLDEENDHV